MSLFQQCSLVPLLAHGAGAVDDVQATPLPVPDLCQLNLTSPLTFTIWDVPTARCPAAHGCRGNGSGAIVRGEPGRGVPCDGVIMESAGGMAATFMTSPFLIEPTVVYNVSWEVRTTGLEAISAALTGGVCEDLFSTCWSPRTTRISDPRRRRPWRRWPAMRCPSKRLSPATRVPP